MGSQYGPMNPLKESEVRAHVLKVVHNGVSRVSEDDKLGAHAYQRTFGSSFDLKHLFRASYAVSYLVEKHVTYLAEAFFRKPLSLRRMRPRNLFVHLGPSVRPLGSRLT